MGFPLEIAKKAVIQAKNKGLNEALDFVFTLQTEEA